MSPHSGTLVLVLVSSILLRPVASRGMVPMYSDELSGPVIVRVISMLDFLLLQNVFIDVGCNQLSVVGAWRRTSRLNKIALTKESHRNCTGTRWKLRIQFKCAVMFIKHTYVVSTQGFEGLWYSYI